MYSCPGWKGDLKFGTGFQEPGAWVHALRLQYLGWEWWIPLDKPGGGRGFFHAGLGFVGF